MFTNITESQEFLDDLITKMNDIMGNWFVNTYEDLKIRATKQNYELVYFSQLFELLKDS